MLKRSIIVLICAILFGIAVVIIGNCMPASVEDEPVEFGEVSDIKAEPVPVVEPAPVVAVVPGINDYVQTLTKSMGVYN